MAFLTPEHKARIVRLQSRGKCPSEIIKLLADADMEGNNEMTSPLLARKIYEEFGLNFSIQKVKRL